MIDYHMHTDYTEDAEGKVEDYCKIADKKGIEEIAFTNHFIIINKNKPRWTIMPGEIAKHLKDIESAKKKFNVKIKTGLEVDYWKARNKEIDDVLSNHQFDFLLGSVHYIGDYLIGGTKEEASEFFKNKSMIEIYEAYFARVVETIESQLFDVIAHPDYIRKNIVKCFGKELSFEEYRKSAEKVIEALIDNKVGIEVNSSGYFHGLGDSFPTSDFLKTCLESGVKVITIGSDSHRPSTVGSNLKKVVEKLTKNDCKKICSFDKRKPRKIDIENIRKHK